MLLRTPETTPETIDFDGAGTPETVDFGFLEKYNTEREVDDEDREKVWEYASIGLVQTGLSENINLTAKLTESGKRLLEEC